MDQYEIGKLSQLSVAHKCSVLFFTKDKFSTLGKKLRPEFERLFLSSELKDCTKLLGKTIGEGSEPRNIVDLVTFIPQVSLSTLLTFSFSTVYCRCWRTTILVLSG